MIIDIIVAGWIAAWIVFVLNCNIWYWSLPKEERNKDDGMWE